MQFELEQGIAEVIISQLEPMKQALERKKGENEMLEGAIAQNKVYIANTEQYIANVEELKSQYDAQMAK